MKTQHHVEYAHSLSLWLLCTGQDSYSDSERQRERQTEEVKEGVFERQSWERETDSESQNMPVRQRERERYNGTDRAEAVSQ